MRETNEAHGEPRKIDCLCKRKDPFHVVKINKRTRDPPSALSSLSLFPFPVFSLSNPLVERRKGKERDREVAEG
jgi:hypothetical protein